MYVGDDVSPDFYGWVFPKYDHVGVGTGTVVNRPAIKDYQVTKTTEKPCLGPGYLVLFLGEKVRSLLFQKLSKQVVASCFPNRLLPPLSFFVALIFPRNPSHQPFR